MIQETHRAVTNPFICFLILSLLYSTIPGVIVSVFSFGAESQNSKGPHFGLALSRHQSFSHLGVFEKLLFSDKVSPLLSFILILFLLLFLRTSISEPLGFPLLVFLEAQLLSAPLAQF